MPTQFQYQCVSDLYWITHSPSLLVNTLPNQLEHFSLPVLPLDYFTKLDKTPDGHRQLIFNKANEIDIPLF